MHIRNALKGPLISVFGMFSLFTAISLSHWIFDPRGTMKTSRLGVSNLFLAKVGQLEAKDWKWHEFWFVSLVAQSRICFFWMFKVPRTNLIYPSRKVKRQKFDSFNREVKMLYNKRSSFYVNVQEALIGGNPRSGAVPRGPCVRKLFTGLIMYLPSQNKGHCIVLYCIVLFFFPFCLGDEA